MPRKTALLDQLEPQIVDDAERRVRATNALPLARITVVKLSSRARDELVKYLVARGLERTSKVVRVPVAAQIDQQLVGGARVPRKDLAKRVKGATKVEIDATLAKLIRDGRVHVVVRTLTEVIVGAGERVLAVAEMSQLAKAITTLAKTVKTIQSKGLPKTMLREDLEAVLGSSLPGPKSALTNSADSADRLVVDALRQIEDPALKLVRIPDLVRMLAQQVPTDAVHRALTKAAEKGIIELRPDAGSEFLKPEDMSLCLPGPRGTVFSYARRVSS